LKVEGVHLCCGKCVKAVNHALTTVDGVTTNDATKGAQFFIVTGNFKDSDVFAALQKAGLTGKVGQ
jgi:periplasmic mercuric ion binding protein